MRGLWTAALGLLLLALAACGAPAAEDPAPGEQPSAAATPSESPSPGASTAAPAPRPAQLVAITTDHRLVVVDVATGEVLRVLVEGDDPDDFGGEGEEPFAGGSFLDSLTVDQAGATVWFSTCCEPAPGTLRTVPLGGGEPSAAGFGYDPALHPVRDQVAVVEMQWVSVTGRDGRAVHRFEAALDPPVQIAKPSWSPDGATLALEVTTGDGAAIHLLPADAERLDAARVLPAQEARAPWRTPVFDRDGALWVVEQPPTAEAPGGPSAAARLRVDPASGEVLERRDLPGEVVRQTYDRGGTHLLIVLADGRVLWESGGDSGVVPGSFAAAAW